MPYIDESELLELQNEIEKYRKEALDTKNKLEETLKDSDELKNKYDEAKSELLETKNQLTETKNKLAGAYFGNSDELKNKLEETEKELLETKNELTEAKNNLTGSFSTNSDELKNKLEETEKELLETKNQLIDARHELENIEEDDDEEEESDYDEETYKKSKKRSLIGNILLSLLAGIALALAFFFYNKKGSSVDINEIKKLEATRVLDSISNSGYATIDDNSTSSDDMSGISTDETISNLKQGIKGEKVYSVQIGAFSENNYQLLSESIAGITSNGDLFKYSIGIFKTLREAQDFRQELVRIGFEDAFVASYVDGVRQSIEDPN